MKTVRQRSHEVLHFVVSTKQLLSELPCHNRLRVQISSKTPDALMASGSHDLLTTQPVEEHPSHETRAGRVRRLINREVRCASCTLNKICVAPERLQMSNCHTRQSSEEETHDEPERQRGVHSHDLRAACFGASHRPEKKMRERTASGKHPWQHPMVEEESERLAWPQTCHSLKQK